MPPWTFRITDLGTGTATEALYFHSDILDGGIGVIGGHAELGDGITPDADHGFVEGRAYMHEAGIVGDERSGATYQVGRFVE